MRFTLAAAAAVNCATSATAWITPRHRGPPTHWGPPGRGEYCNPMKGEVGAAFAMTNEAADNKVIAFSRDSAGKLTKSGSFSTGGHGIGVDFDAQGGLMLSKDNKYLYGVSPGDDKITVFKVNRSCLERQQVIYAGDQPLAITMHGDLLYVLDGSVASTGIFGFHVGNNGMLEPIGNSTIATSTPIGVPGGLSFSPDGRSIVVANKVGSILDSYSVGHDGVATLVDSAVDSSSGMRPFSLTFRSDGTLYVVESGLGKLMNAGVSTYSLNTGSGALTIKSNSVKNHQTDGCWIVFNGNEEYVYTANFVSGSISSYKANNDGTVTLLNGAAGQSGKMSQPVDLGVSKDGKMLFNLLRGTGAIAAWNIENDGSLTTIGIFGEGEGLPAMNGASGMAVY